MFTNEEFKDWCKECSFFPETIALIEQIRSSEPARRVQGNRGNTVTRYVSRKMDGRTLQAESHTAELPYLVICEGTSEIIEMWDQPEGKVFLEYQGPSGKKVAYWSTADYFII